MSGAYLTAERRGRGKEPDMTLDDYTALSITHQRETELQQKLEQRRRRAEIAAEQAGGRLALISRMAREARRSGRSTPRLA